MMALAPPWAGHVVGHHTTDEPLEPVELEEPVTACLVGFNQLPAGARRAPTSPSPQAGEVPKGSLSPALVQQVQLELRGIRAALGGGARSLEEATRALADCGKRQGQLARCLAKAGLAGEEEAALPPDQAPPQEKAKEDLQGPTP